MYCRSIYSFVGIVTFISLLFFCPLCCGNNTRRLEDEEKSVLRRFIFDSNHQFTGWSSWQQYAACSTLCVSGYEKQTKECCDTGDNRLCYNIPWDQLKSRIGTCPNDGQWGAWGTWSLCSATCDNGVKQRSRSCEFDQSRPHGKACPAGDGSETQSCSVPDCPVDGVWLGWSTWTACSVTCGGGVANRHRNCHYQSNMPHGQMCFGQAAEHKSCNTDVCPDWSTWTTCSVTCGGGSRFRTRNCNFPINVPKGDNCTGQAAQQQSCNTNLCPVDGVWLTWSTWTACPVTCGGGVENRRRKCHYPPNVPHGLNCAGEAAQQQSCSTNLCPEDGKWTIWGRWSLCSVTCGHGAKQRSRSCAFDPIRPHGSNCFGSRIENQNCTEPDCPVDGTWLEWQNWSTCSATCGGGTRHRNRNCQFPPHVSQGAYCPGKGRDAQSCNNKTCQGSCFTCQGPPVICEKLNFPQDCPLDKQFCINTLSNYKNASRIVDMRCGTREECKYSFDKYAKDDKCTTFDQTYIYTNRFDCIFCCDTDNCNQFISPPTKWSIFSTTPTTTPTTIPTITPTTTPRSCFTCQGPPVICEKLNFPQDCPLDKQFCINTLSNYKNASRMVDMRCGTREECKNGWFDKYAKDDKCTRFDQTYIYTSRFDCEFCCDTDNCNQFINMPNKWSPN